MGVAGHFSKVTETTAINGPAQNKGFIILPSRHEKTGKLFPSASVSKKAFVNYFSFFKEGTFWLKGEKRTKGEYFVNIISFAL